MYKEAQATQAMGYLSTKPTMIITTLHETMIVNAGVFGAYTNLSPTQLGVAVGTTSHTHANTVRTGEFVINVPGADLVKKIAILAEPIPPDRSEVEEAGLSTKPGLTVGTPSIAECVAAVECRFEQKVPIGHHDFLIAHVTGGWIREDCLDDDGRIDIFKAKVFKDFKYPRSLYVLPGEIVEG